MNDENHAQPLIPKNSAPSASPSPVSAKERKDLENEAHVASKAGDAPPQKSSTVDSLQDWLSGRIAAAESILRSREQMEATWRSGDDKSWEAASAMHPSTAGSKPMKKADRLREADAQGRIAVKCRRELEMFKAVNGLLSQIRQGAECGLLHEFKHVAQLKITER